jgi:hypothetical protein
MGRWVNRMKWEDKFSYYCPFLSLGIKLGVFLSRVYNTIHPGHQSPVLELSSCILVSKVLEVIILDGAYKTSSLLI